MNENQRFASVWDAIEDTPEDAAMMKALSAERMRQEADGAQTPAQVKWNRENFVKGLVGIPDDRDRSFRRIVTDDSGLS